MMGMDLSKCYARHNVGRHYTVHHNERTIINSRCDGGDRILAVTLELQNFAIPFSNLQSGQLLLPKRTQTVKVLRQRSFPPSHSQASLLCGKDSLALRDSSYKILLAHHSSAYARTEIRMFTGAGNDILPM